MSDDKSPTPETGENEYHSNDERSVVVVDEPVISSVAGSSLDDDALNMENDNGDKEKDKTETSSSSSEALAKGISSILSTVIKDFDCRAEDTVKSQDQLCFSIDRLTRELDQLLEDAPLPFIMQHAAKISGVRKRVTSLNSVLKSIQRRVDNMDRMLSAGLAHEKATKESTGQH